MGTDDVHSFATSEPLTVPFTEGIADKGIREFTWKLSLPKRDHEARVGLVKAGFRPNDESVLVNGVSVPPVLQAVIGWNIKRKKHLIPLEESHEIHFAIAEGLKDGKHRRVTCRMIGHPNPLYEDYVDAGTSMCMSIGVQQILSKTLRPGVWAPEEYFDPQEFFAEMRKRHFEIDISIAYGSTNQP